MLTRKLIEDRKIIGLYRDCSLSFVGPLNLYIERKLHFYNGVFNVVMEDRGVFKVC